MSIIFEGPDGVGKTTKANSFISFNNEYVYIHNWAKPTNKIDQESEIAKELLLLSSGHKLVIDRSYILSEFVYANVLQRKSIVTLAYIKRIVEIINSNNHTVNLILFRNKENLIVKDEDKHLPFEQINSAYYKLFKSLAFNKLIVEYVEDREEQ